MRSRHPTQSRAQGPLVRVTTLGHFNVEVGGRPLVFAGKSQRRPLAILKALASSPSGSIHVQQALDSLWPDAEGDKAYRAFSSALSRLRKLIGRESVGLNDGRLSVDPSACWIDAREFESALGQATQAAQASLVDAAWAHLQRALELYGGPFLDGDFESPETLHARSRLHSSFLRHLEFLGRYFDSQGAWEKSVEAYRRGLECEPVAEELCRELMRSLSRMGRKGEAIAAYHRCCQALEENGGAQPSNDTERLYRNLLTPSPMVDTIASEETGARETAFARPRKEPEHAPVHIPIMGQQTPLPSIAVLPFQNLSGDPLQDHIGDGLTDELITQLSRDPRISVVPRTSVLGYAARGIPILPLGRALGVRFVVEGSVRRFGDQFRVNTQLIDAASGRHIWVKRYDRRDTDVIRVQDDLVREIRADLEVYIIEGPMVRRWRSLARDSQTVDLLRQARNLVSVTNTPAGALAARELCAQAIQLESDVAIPYINYALYSILALWLGADVSPVDLAQILETAREYVEKGLALDPTQGHGYTVLGYRHLLLLNRDEAVRVGELALRVEPDSSQVCSALGWIYLCTGRPEQGLHLLQRARLLAPVPTQQTITAAGIALTVLGRYEEALQSVRPVAAKVPDALPAQVCLSAALAASGRLDEARQHGREILRILSGVPLSRVLPRVLAFVNPAHSQPFIDWLTQAGAILPPAAELGPALAPAAARTRI